MPEIERHPWPAFVPEGARVLLLGTFPPKRERWSMDFFYPNRTNDMWRVFGLIFGGDSEMLYDKSERRFRLPLIKQVLAERHIAMWDTAMAVRRLRDNASDKFLEIVEPIRLAEFLDRYPTIEGIITAGEKATAVVAEQAGVAPPATGKQVECTINNHRFTLHRMPSTSRAYPLALERKAEAYQRVFQQLNLC